MAELCILTEAQCSPAFNWPTEKLKNQLRALTTKTFIAEAVGSKDLEPLHSRILAFICFVDLGPAVEIPVLATFLAVQRQGIMRELLLQAIAMHYQDRELWLEVHENNQAARNLYRTLGFVESGRRNKYYPDGSAAILCNRNST